MTPYEEYDAEDIEDFRKFKKEQRAIRKAEKEKAQAKRKKVNEMYATISKWKRENKDSENSKRVFIEENRILKKHLEIKKQENTQLNEKSIINFAHSPKSVDKETKKE